MADHTFTNWYVQTIAAQEVEQQYQNAWLNHVWFIDANNPSQCAVIDGIGDPDPKPIDPELWLDEGI
jgi:hypothetical protein